MGLCSKTRGSHHVSHALGVPLYLPTHIAVIVVEVLREAGAIEAFRHHVPGVCCTIQLPYAGGRLIRGGDGDKGARGCILRIPRCWRESSEPLTLAFVL